MATLTITSENRAPCISVPSWFIRDYMPQAMGGYVKVYLYLLTAYYEQKDNLSIEDTANLLSMLSSEVLAALEYWQQQKVLSFTATSTEDFEISFTFVAPSSSSSSLTSEEKTEVGVNSKTYIQQTRPNYTPTELAIYLHDAEVQKLYKMAEKILGRLLSSSDQQILFGLYDWLHMPIDLIEYLLEHCATKGHTSMRYIERTAIGWIDEGIHTLAAAKNKASIDQTYFTILSEVGLGTQNITSVQKDFMNKWLHSYNLNVEVILEGCRKAVAQTKNPSLKYLDSIFKDWHKNNVCSLDDVKKLDAAFISKQQMQSNKKLPATKAPVKQTSFNSVQRREWDFSELERLERDRIQRLLNEGS